VGVPLFCFYGMERLSKRVYELADEVAMGLRCDIDDIELFGEGRRQLLRVVIDRPEGVTLDDCEAFSRDFGALLDVEDPIMGPYTLEVSSPGLDRPLKRPEHYQKSIGKLAKIVLLEPLEGIGSVVVARIAGVRPGGVLVDLGGREIAIDFKNIKKARLEVEL
jgi:ribosome maturation factor RimP